MGRPLRDAATGGIRFFGPGLVAMLGAWLFFAASSFSQQPASPPPAPAAAGGEFDGVLGQYKIPLSPLQRAALVREALEKKRWSDIARITARALAVDTTSGYVDQIPWISRLRLAQAFLWLGTPETDLAKPVMDRAQEEKGRKANSATVFGSPDNQPRPGILADRFKPETLSALLNNEPLIGLLGEAVVEDDYVPGVWRVLAGLQEQNPQGVADFPALAVAFAVVYDLPFPDAWPHHQAKREEIPFVADGWGDLFDYFVAAQREQALQSDLSTLRVDQLRFLVDIPLRRSELEWARKNVRIPRAEFEKTFFSVSYDTKRFQNDVFDWPNGPYTLESIRSSGGICIDQSYFATMAGKALGIPTLSFVGEGDLGAHAWFGFLKEDGKWLLDAGRYANQNYVVGAVRDPQTWKEINDHQLAFLSDPGDSLTLYHYSRNLLALSALPGIREDAALRQRLLAQALQVNPRLPEIWEAVAAALHAQEPGPERTAALRRHYQEMADQFASQDDLRVEAQLALVDLERAAGEGDAAADLWNQILSARSDLAIKAEAAELVGRASQGDLDGTMADYHNAVDFFVRRIRKRDRNDKVALGDLLNSLVYPYIRALDDARRDDLAAAALAEAVQRFHFDDDRHLNEEVEELAAWIQERRKARQDAAN